MIISHIDFAVFPCVAWLTGMAHPQDVASGQHQLCPWLQWLQGVDVFFVPMIRSESWYHWIGFVGKILLETHGFLPSNWSGFPVNFPVIQFYDGITEISPIPWRSFRKINSSKKSCAKNCFTRWWCHVLPIATPIDRKVVNLEMKGETSFGSQPGSTIRHFLEYYKQSERNAWHMLPPIMYIYI